MVIWDQSDSHSCPYHIFIVQEGQGITMDPLHQDFPPCHQRETHTKIVFKQ